jgi:hypothetical protein
MLSVYIQIGIFLATVVFAAGGAWVRAGRVAKDVNGVGARLKTIDKEQNDRNVRVCMAVIAIAPDDKKQMVIEALGGKTE